MNRFLLALSTSWLLLASVACNFGTTPLSEDIDTTATSLVTLSTVTLTPTAASTSSSTPTLNLLPTATPMVTSSFTPDEIVLPGQKPQKLSMAKSEIEQIRFVDNNTVAYLQWGTIYTHNLATQQTKTVAGSGNISSFDWSESQQQFVVVQERQLYLLDETGTQIQNLSHTLPVIHPNSEFIEACFWNEMAETDNLLEHVKWVLWHPVGPNIIFGAANIDDYITHHCGPKIWSANIPENQVTEIGQPTNYNPQPHWLNKNILLLHYYTGGGSHLYNVVNISNAETIFEFGGYAGFTRFSASGNRLLNTSEGKIEFQAWETLTGTELWQESFSIDTVAYRTAWSFDERYVVVGQAQKIFHTSPESKTPISLLVFDMETKQKWQSEHQFFGYIQAAWLPDRNEMLIFNTIGEDTKIFSTTPKEQTFELIRAIPKKSLRVFDWSSTHRYLVLSEIQAYRAIWLFDNQSVEPFSPIYELNLPDGAARFDNFMWSPDDSWFIFTEQSGPAIPVANDADITLRGVQIPTGQHQAITVWEIP